MIRLAPELTDVLERGLDMVLCGYWTILADYDDEGVRGLMAFDKITATDCEIHPFGQRGFLSRALLRAAGELVFSAYNVERVTAHMRASNTTLHRVAERLGFVMEGRPRKYYGDEDAVMYGLLKEDYPHGFQQTPQARSNRPSVSVGARSPV